MYIRAACLYLPEFIVEKAKKMKKTLAILLSVIMIVMIAGCGTKNVEDEPADDDVTVRLGGLKGPTTMGMVKLLDDAENGLTDNKYEFTLEATADALTPALLRGELDIISIPANAAAILYAKSGGEVQVLGVNTLGVLSIVEKNGSTISTLSDLRGKTIYATGKGTTPEYVLSYLLGTVGLDAAADVEIIWKSEPSEIVALMATMDSAVAMLPQPFVTVAQNTLSDLRIAIDLTDLWEAGESTSGSLCTSVLLARKAFVAEHPSATAKFISEYGASADYVNANTEDASLLVEKYGIVAAAVAKKAIPHCHLVCITGNEMKEALSGYLGVLYEKDASSVGGALPGDDFYMIQ